MAATSVTCPSVLLGYYLVREVVVATTHGHANPGPAAFRQLFARILGPESGFYKVVLVYSVAISLLTLAIPLSVQLLIDTVSNTGLFSAVISIGVLLFLLLLVSGVLYALRAWTMEMFSRRLFARISAEIAMTGLLARIGSFEPGRRAALFNRFFDIMTLKKNVPYILSNGFTLLFQGVIGFIMVSLYHFYFFIFSVGLILLIWLVWKLWSWKAITSAFDLSQAKHDTGAWLQGLAVNNAFFKTQHCTDAALQESERLIRSHLDAQAAHFHHGFRQLLSFLLLYALASAVLLAIGGWLVIRGELTLGQLVAAELIMSAILYSLPQLSGYLGYYYDVCAAAEELYRLDAVEVENLATLEPAPAPQGPLQLRKLQAGAAGGDMMLNLELPPASVVVASAPNGRVQDTFCRLLRRDVEVRSGGMWLGDLDLLSCSLPQQRSLLCVLDRQTLVPMTVRSYLALAGGSVTPSRLHEVLALLDLDTCIRELPAGLDTELSYSGAPLLLDQALRLKLAFVLLGEARVLVLTQIFDCVARPHLQAFMDAWRSSGRILIAFSQREVPGADMQLELRDDYHILSTDTGA
jgi:putative ABC transport system ATP-binding protein